MTKNQWDDEVEKYSQCSNEELAKEFVMYDFRVNELWSQVDDNTSDRREILLALIGERFVKQHTGIVWSDDKGNWSVKMAFEVV